MSNTENKPSDALSLDELEKDLAEGPGGADPEATKKIDKFYTFYQKKEEFQKLLDSEYSRLRGDHIEIPEEELGEYAGVESNVSRLNAAAAVTDADDASASGDAADTTAAAKTAEEDHPSTANTGRTSAMVQGEGDTMSVNFDTGSNIDAVPKKKKKPVWLILLILAIIVAACVFGIMHFGLLDNSNEAVGEAGARLAEITEHVLCR